ncbi:MAG: bile acid:sodium symporter family protein [bacterium]|nr:bile acid:sodium symporter family protein [bacterium]
MGRTSRTGRTGRVGRMGRREMVYLGMQRVSEICTRLLPVWVVAAGVGGYVYPPLLRWLDGRIEWLFAATMVGIGAVLKPGDFLPVVRTPHWVVLGTLAQFTIMPVLGYGVARVMDMPRELALGFILVGSVPGAMASNVISYLARADVAYSIALTTCSTLLAPVVTPGLVYVFGKTLVEVRFWPMFFNIVRIVIVPLLVGVGLRYWCGRVIERVAWVFPLVSAVAIALICGLVVALNKERLVGMSGDVIAGVVLHNGLGLLGGYCAGWAYGFDGKRRRTLAIEVGMQNAGLGAVLALKHFGAEAALPNAVFASWCVVTAAVLVELWRARGMEEKEGESAKEERG